MSENGDHPTSYDCSKTHFFFSLFISNFPQNREYSNVPYSGYYKFLSPAINLRDADLIKDVLIKDHFSFHINEQQFDEKTDPLMILNPFGAKDDIWRKARTVLTPLLTLFKVTINTLTIIEIWKKSNHDCSRYSDLKFKMGGKINVSFCSYTFYRNVKTIATTYHESLFVKNRLKCFIVSISFPLPSRGDGLSSRG